MYSCSICNYDTNDKCNFNRHTNSKKHADKKILKSNLKINSVLKPELLCNFCNKKYANMGSLEKHTKICGEKVIIEKQHSDQLNILKNAHVKELEHIKQLYENELQYLKELHEKDTLCQTEILKQKDETINVLNTEVNHLKLLINNAGSIIKSSVSALSYAMKHYKDAPALETIKDYSALKYNQSDTEFIENLLVEYKNKLLPTYLGNFIIKIYKKDDPLKQSIWNSDTNRLTYVIKEILNNNKTDWQIDKKGIKTTNYIIVPILTYIEGLLRSYIENFDMTYNLYVPHEAEKKMLKLKYSTDILQSIEDKVLHDDVLKYIASHFFINKNGIN